MIEFWLSLLYKRITDKEIKMKKYCAIPPDTCVSIEFEKGAVIGFRKAVLLNEIKALKSLTKAAKVAKIERDHAVEIIEEMNKAFSAPLVEYQGELGKIDTVKLTERGEKIAHQYWQKFEPVWLSIIEERSRHF